MQPNKGRISFHHDELQTREMTTSPPHSIQTPTKGSPDRILPSLTDQLPQFETQFQYVKDLQMMQYQMQCQMQYQMQCQMQYQMQLMRMKMSLESHGFPLMASNTTASNMMAPKTYYPTSTLKHDQPTQPFQSTQPFRSTTVDLSTSPPTVFIPQDRMLPLPIPSSMISPMAKYEAQAQHIVPQPHHESIILQQSDSHNDTISGSQKSPTLRPLPKIEHLCSLVQLSLRDKAAVKRMTPYNSFVIYMLAHRDELRKADPFLSNKDLTKRLAEEWAEVPSSQKSQYRKLARDLTIFRDGHPQKKAPNGNLRI